MPNYCHVYHSLFIRVPVFFFFFSHTPYLPPFFHLIPFSLSLSPFFPSASQDMEMPVGEDSHFVIKVVSTGMAVL